MTLHPFEQFVSDRIEWFRGYNPEPVEGLRCAEEELQQLLPVTMKWLLSHHGYWRATGVGGLPFIVGATLQCRPEFPENWIVLSRSRLPAAWLGENWKEQNQRPLGMVILVVSEKNPLDGKAVIVCDGTGKIVRRYSGFSAYVMGLQQALEQTTNPLYVNCLNSFHQELSGSLKTSAEEFNLQEFQRRVLETLLFFRLSQAHDMDFEKPEGIAEQSEFSTVAETMACDCTSVMQKTGQSHVESLRVWEQETVPVQSVVPHVAAVLAAEMKGPAESSGWELETAGKQTAVSEQKELTTEEQMRTIVGERREFLQQHLQELPQAFVYSSSSSRQDYKLPEILPEGQLLLTPVMSDNDSLTGESWLAGLQLESCQHVTLLRQQRGDGIQDWLVSWVPGEQVAKLTLAYFEKTRSVPPWILEAGEGLDELPARLERLNP